MSLPAHQLAEGEGLTRSSSSHARSPEARSSTLPSPVDQELGGQNILFDQQDLHTDQG
jgi:hypothetical protein